MTKCCRQYNLLSAPVHDLDWEPDSYTSLEPGAWSLDRAMDLTRNQKGSKSSFYYIGDLDTIISWLRLLFVNKVCKRHWISTACPRILTSFYGIVNIHGSEICDTQFTKYVKKTVPDTLNVICICENLTLDVLILSGSVLSSSDLESGSI